MTDGPALDTHRYDQRLDGLAAAFQGRYGEVIYGQAVSRSGESRKLEIRVDVPGWGLPPSATLVFVEKHRRQAQRWVRYEYAYDLHLEPRPAGRYAFHWARDVYHLHCADPRHPAPDHHYKGVPIDDVFWAAEELFVMAARGPSCAGLVPLRDWHEDR